MVDLDSNPTKLIDIVEIGKQMLITRGSLTTFSIANDVAKYFAIIPAMFAGALPALDALNVMRLDSPRSAILSAVIFNALVHSGAHPTRAAGCALPRRGRGCDVAPQPAHLRRRRLDRAIRRHQADRPRRRRARDRLMRRQLLPALLFFVAFTVVTGLLYPLVMTGVARSPSPTAPTARSSSATGASSAPGCSVRASPAPATSIRDRRLPGTATTARRAAPPTSGRPIRTCSTPSVSALPPTGRRTVWDPRTTSRSTPSPLPARVSTLTSPAGCRHSGGASRRCPRPHARRGSRARRRAHRRSVRWASWASRV